MKDRNFIIQNTSGTNTGDITLAGGSKDFIQLTNQVVTVNQVDLTDDVTGVLPYVTHDGLSHEQVKKGKMSKELFDYGHTWDFPVMPMVIPKKYANKLDVKEANLEMMEGTMKVETTDWSVI